MTEFKLEHLVIVLLLAVVIAVAVLAIKKRHDIIEFFKKPEIRNRIKQLILAVEHDLSTPDGYRRLFRVISYIWSFLPPSLKPFITVEYLCAVVQQIFDLLAEKQDGHTVPVDKEIN